MEIFQQNEGGLRQFHGNVAPRRARTSTINYVQLTGPRDQRPATTVLATLGGFLEAYRAWKRGWSPDATGWSGNWAGAAWGRYGWARTSSPDGRWRSRSCARPTGSARKIG